MGYSYMYLADATFPPNALDGWLAAVPSSQPFEDWPSQWGLEYEADAMQVEETTREILEFLAAEEMTLVEIGADRIRVRALVAKDGDGWLTYRSALASAFRGAGKRGGTATFHAITSDDAAHDAGFLVESAPGDDRCLSLSQQGVRDVRDGAAGAELQAIVERWVAENT